ncbi:hypothetical protein [Methylorubrum sp. SB2]|uniref:hypothetical protein n=1 Tax=Methylorubrum subtropicum TaxID=3138812 RepID=UPI00313AA3C2
MATFTQSQIEALTAALGDTADGLTGSEIAHLLNVATMKDPGAGLTKRHRLHNAFAESQNKRGDRGAILKFLRQVMKPDRYLRVPARFEALRAKVKAALSFAGLAVDQEFAPALFGFAP